MSTEADRAGSTIVLAGVVGAMGLVASTVALLVVGGEDGGGGSGWGLVLVLLVGAGSALLLLVAAVGWGVELGVRASGVPDRLPTGTRRGASSSSRPPARRATDRLEPLEPLD